MSNSDLKCFHCGSTNSTCTRNADINDKSHDFPAYPLDMMLFFEFYHCHDCQQKFVSRRFLGYTSIPVGGNECISQMGTVLILHPISQFNLSATPFDAKFLGLLNHWKCKITSAERKDNLIIVRDDTQGVYTFDLDLQEPRTNMSRAHDFIQCHCEYAQS